MTTRADLSGRLSVIFGLPETEAAGSIGIGLKKFRQMVADGRMPKPRRADRNAVWDVEELHAAFKDLPHDDPGGIAADPDDAGDADGWDDLL